MRGLRIRLAERALLLSEAAGRVSRQYKESQKAQEGELRWYAVGVWMRGFGNREREAVESALGIKAGLRGPGWWDATPSRRDAWFFAMGVEASTAHRATLLCLDRLTQQFEDNGIRPAEAVRIEAEPLPDDYSPAIPVETKGGSSG